MNNDPLFRWPDDVKAGRALFDSLAWEINSFNAVGERVQALTEMPRFEGISEEIAEFHAAMTTCVERAKAFRSVLWPHLQQMVKEDRHAEY